MSVALFFFASQEVQVLAADITWVCMFAEFDGFTLHDRVSPKTRKRSWSSIDMQGVRRAFLLLLTSSFL